MRRGSTHWAAVAFVACVPASICCAQYRTLAGEVDIHGFPATSARVCLGATGIDHCYTPPSEKHAFGLEPETRVIGQLNGRDLILFTATFSGGGSGSLTNFALLTVRNGELVNLLPEVQLTNQSEYQLWSLPGISDLPMLVTADFIWDFKAMEGSNYTEETHFAHHRYAIKVYIFGQKNERYLQKLSYVTTKKYPGLDDADDIRVLDAEKTVIFAALQSSHPN